MRVKSECRDDYITQLVRVSVEKRKAVGSIPTNVISILSLLKIFAWAVAQPSEHRTVNATVAS